MWQPCIIYNSMLLYIYIYIYIYIMCVCMYIYIYIYMNGCKQLPGLRASGRGLPATVLSISWAQLGSDWEFQVGKGTIRASLSYI